MSRCIGEFPGAFALVLAGTGTIVVNDVGDGAIPIREFRRIACTRSGFRIAVQSLDSPDRSLGGTLTTAYCRPMHTGDGCPIIEAVMSGCADEVS